MLCLGNVEVEPVSAYHHLYSSMAFMEDLL